MDIKRFSYKKIQSCSNKLNLALGDFDGFHRGHQSLLFEARKQGEFGALLLSQNPFKQGGSLTSLDDKLRRFSAFGLDETIILDVDDVFFDLSKESFINDVLLPLNPQCVFCGEDYRFGRHAEGVASDLQNKLPTQIVPLLESDGKKISSSSIKDLIRNGQIREACMLLGHPYQLSGKVERGFGNGKKIGFPTANLNLFSDYVLPRSGVYAGIAYLSGVPYEAMINVGSNPTLGLLDHPIVEIHLLSYVGECYGKTIYLDFVSFLREEMKFSSLDELKQQLVKDKEKIHSALREFE